MQPPETTASVSQARDAISSKDVGAAFRVFAIFRYIDYNSNSDFSEDVTSKALPSPIVSHASVTHDIKIKTNE